MSLSLSKCDSSEDWSKLLSESDQGNIFCSNFFLELTNNHKNIYFVKKDKEIVAGVVVCEVNSSKISIPFLYQGIIFNQKLLSKKEHKLSAKYLETTKFIIENITRVHENFKISLDHSLDDLRPFQWFEYNQPSKKKFIIDIKYTGLLDLSLYLNFDEYLQSIRSVRRQEYKKNLNKFLIEEQTEIDDLDMLHIKTFERQNLKRNKTEETMITHVIFNLLKKNMGKLFVLRNKDNLKPIAASYFLHDKNNAYNLTLASDPAERKTSPGTTLILKQIEFCFKNKINLIDFVGINSPNRGDYKTSFNARPKIYFNIEY